MSVRQELPRVQVLTSRTNWASWKGSIEANARWVGVWRYCDPDIPGEQHHELKEPEKPHVSTVRPGATSIVDLGEADFAELSSIVDKYWQQMRVYEETQAKLDVIFQLIRTHVDRNHFSLVEHATTPREQLMLLGGEFKESPLEALESEWELLQCLAQGSAVQELFERWNDLFAHCADQDARKECVFWGFLEAAAKCENPRQPLCLQNWVRGKYSPSDLQSTGRALCSRQRRVQAERDWDEISSRCCVGSAPRPTKLASRSLYPPPDDDLGDQDTGVWDGSVVSEDVTKGLVSQHEVAADGSCRC